MTIDTASYENSDHKISLATKVLWDFVKKGSMCSLQALNQACMKGSAT